MLRLLLIVVFLVALILVALSNTEAQTLWIVSHGWQIPLGTLVLIVGLLSFVVGAVVMAASEIKQRSRARRAEQKTRTLESQILDLHQRMDRLNQTAETTRSLPSGEAPLAPQGVPPVIS